MNKNSLKYTEVEYWNKRYSQEEEFDWLQQGYQETLELLSAEIDKRDSEILILGCGNSNLTRDMHRKGFSNMVSTDISETCIAKQSEKHKEDMPGVSWMVLDMTDMNEIESDSFDVVLEKATLDALLAGEQSQWSPSEEARQKVHSSLLEISRVLKEDGGRFFSVTFSQPHFRLPLLAKSEYGWDVETRVLQGSNDALPIYCFIATRGKELDTDAVDRWTRVSQLKIDANSDFSSSDDDEESFFSKISQASVEDDSDCDS